MSTRRTLRQRSSGIAQCRISDLTFWSRTFSGVNALHLVFLTRVLIPAAHKIMLHGVLRYSRFFSILTQIATNKKLCQPLVVPLRFFTLVFACVAPGPYDSSECSAGYTWTNASCAKCRRTAHASTRHSTSGGVHVCSGVPVTVPIGELPRFADRQRCFFLSFQLSAFLASQFSPNISAA